MFGEKPTMNSVNDAGAVFSQASTMNVLVDTSMHSAAIMCRPALTLAALPYLAVLFTMTASCGIRLKLLGILNAHPKWCVVLSTQSNGLPWRPTFRAGPCQPPAAC